MSPFAQAGLDSGFRFHQILCDGMAPTIRPRDYVLVAPAHRYEGEGYYLVVNAFGDPVPYDCVPAGTRAKPMIRLRRHNERYADELVTSQRFDEIVLARIAMICNVVHSGLLDRLQRQHVMGGADA